MILLALVLAPVVAVLHAQRRKPANLLAPNPTTQTASGPSPLATRSAPPVRESTLPRQPQTILRFIHLLFIHFRFWR